MDELIPVGWTPIDSTGAIHQSEVSNAYQHMFGHGGPTRKSVRKIYQTEGKAAQYSPVGKAVEVFVKCNTQSA